jgi:hypothetical protein
VPWRSLLSRTSDNRLECAWAEGNPFRHRATGEQWSVTGIGRCAKSGCRRNIVCGIRAQMEGSSTGGMGTTASGSAMGGILARIRAFGGLGHSHPAAERNDHPVTGMRHWWLHTHLRRGCLFPSRASSASARDGRASASGGSPGREAWKLTTIWELDDQSRAHIVIRWHEQTAPTCAIPMRNMSTPAICRGRMLRSMAAPGQPSNTLSWLRGGKWTIVLSIVPGDGAQWLGCSRHLRSTDGMCVFQPECRMNGPHRRLQGTASRHPPNAP